MPEQSSQPGLTQGSARVSGHAWSQFVLSDEEQKLGEVDDMQAWGSGKFTYTGEASPGA